MTLAHRLGRQAWTGPRKRTGPAKSVDGLIEPARRRFGQWILHTTRAECDQP